MSSIWDVPACLVMAFSLALDAPAEKAGQVATTGQAAFKEERAAAVHVSRALSEQAWLRAVKAASPHSNILSGYGSRVFVTSSGRYYVPNARERAEITELQSSPEIATRVLAAATIEFKKELAKATGRDPSRAALLIAHLQGTTAAIAYIKALDGTPQRPAIAAVPQLAEALGKSASEPLAIVDARVSAELDVGHRRVAQIEGARASHTPRSTHEAPLMAGTLTKPDAYASNPKLAAR